jgi:hypothetical protein
LTCGYAVDGLELYYIPNSVAMRARSVAKTASIRVVEGTLTAIQIRMELERLVSAKVTWDVEEVEKNIFKTVFPTKGEMVCMIE